MLVVFPVFYILLLVENYVSSLECRVFQASRREEGRTSV